MVNTILGAYVISKLLPYIGIRPIMGSQSQRHFTRGGWTNGCVGVCVLFPLHSSWSHVQWCFYFPYCFSKYYEGIFPQMRTTSFVKWKNRDDKIPWPLRSIVKIVSVMVLSLDISLCDCHLSSGCRCVLELLLWLLLGQTQWLTRKKRIYLVSPQATETQVSLASIHPLDKVLLLKGAICLLMDI